MKIYVYPRSRTKEERIAAFMCKAGEAIGAVALTMGMIFALFFLLTM